MVGEKLREVRLGQRLSLTQVAQQVGISAATLSRIETNKQSVDVPLFLSLARILKVAAHELLDGDGQSREGDGDHLGRRIAALGSTQRARLWRELAAARRSDRNGRHSAKRTLSQQVDELWAQFELCREEIESVRARLKRRK